MKLGKYFTLAEMTRTSREWINAPMDIHLVNLVRLVALCLDPLREKVGTIHVTSGFRSLDVNREVGGARQSWHMKGSAVDIYHDKHKPMALIRKIQFLGLPFDKLIAEDNGKSRWLHWQIADAGEENRSEIYHAHLKDGKMVYKRVG